jgi:hypothetical protein
MVACTGDGRPDAMHGQWLTYGEAAVRLGVTPEAARRRAIRGKWARMPGNDGRTRVMVPDELHPPRTGPVRPDGSALVDALEGHIATLKADNDQLKAQLAAAEARADKAIAELVALAQRIAVAPQPEPPVEAPADPGGPLYRAWRWMRKTG